MPAELHQLYQLGPVGVNDLRPVKPESVVEVVQHGLIEREKSGSEAAFEGFCQASFFVCLFYVRQFSRLFRQLKPEMEVVEVLSPHPGGYVKSLTQNC